MATVSVLVYSSLADRQNGAAPDEVVYCTGLVEVYDIVNAKVTEGRFVGYQDEKSRSISLEDAYTIFTGRPYPGRQRFVREIETIRQLAEVMRSSVS